MVAYNAADVLFDGFLGALVGAAVTIIAVSMTISSSRAHVARERRIDLALRLGTIASTLELFIHRGDIGDDDKGSLEFREYQLVASGLAALGKKSDPTFAKGLTEIARASVTAMPLAADVNWDLDHEETTNVRVALTATHAWIIRWLGQPEALPSHRYTVEDALIEARKRLGDTTANS